MGDFRSQVRDRPHHGIPDARIVQRVAGTLDQANFGIGPRRRSSCEVAGGHTIVSALHDEAGDLCELAASAKAPWLHEAVVVKIMRFHEGVAGRERDEFSDGRSSRTRPGACSDRIQQYETFCVPDYVAYCSFAEAIVWREMPNSGLVTCSPQGHIDYGFDTF